ncbi:MAG: hypothetical protein IJB05_03625 [Bacteroidales bacterium]|nr:hypothetical protein [Bacteroidales bacterium]
MNKALMNAAGAPLAAGSYESPAVNVVEVLSEGVLCSSFEKYNEEDLEW